MQKNKQLIVTAFFVLTFLMIIFPPWNYVDSHNASESIGYGAFWQPPLEKIPGPMPGVPQTQTYVAPPRTANTVDGLKLLLQIVLLAAVTAAGYVISKDQPRYRKVKS
jgi:hypothetical protein